MSPLNSFLLVWCLSSAQILATPLDMQETRRSDKTLTRIKSRLLKL